MKSNKCKSEAGSSHTDTESCHSNIRCGNRKKAIPPDAVYWDSVRDCPNIKTRDNVKPDLLNLYSEIVNPFSASEKLKRKEFKSQGVDCQLNLSLYSRSSTSINSL